MSLGSWGNSAGYLNCGGGSGREISDSRSSSEYGGEGGGIIILSRGTPSSKPKTCFHFGVGSRRSIVLKSRGIFQTYQSMKILCSPVLDLTSNIEYNFRTIGLFVEHI